jgi:hypothetical protein
MHDIASILENSSKRTRSGLFFRENKYQYLALRVNNPVEAAEDGKGWMYRCVWATLELLLFLS